MKTLKWILLLLVLSDGNGLAAAEVPALIKVEICRQKAVLVQLRANGNRAGSLVVKSISKGPLHFYVFDVSGNIVFHALLLPGTSRNIEALKNGEYSYDVFHNDEGVEQGKILVHQKVRAV
jgi:hypothetical protein